MDKNHKEDTSFEPFSLERVFNDISFLADAYIETLFFIPGTTKTLDKAEKQAWDKETTISALTANYKKGEKLSTAMNVATGLGFLAAGVAATTITPVLFLPIYLFGAAQLILTYSYTKEPNSKHMRRAQAQFKKHFE